MDKGQCTLKTEMYNGHWALETAMDNEQWTLETKMDRDIQCPTMELNVLEHSSTFIANVKCHFIIYGVQGVPPRTGH